MTKSKLPPLKVSLRDVLFVLFSKKQVLLGIFFTVFFLTLVFAVLAKPQYEATAIILVKPSVVSLLQDTQGRSNILEVTPQKINSEIGIITSANVLRMAVGRLKLVDDPNDNDGINLAVDKFKARLKAEPVTMSDMIEVKMRGDDPKETASTLNVLVNTYLDQQSNSSQPREGAEFFTGEAKGRLDTTLLLEKRLREYQKQWSIVDVEAQKQQGLKVLEAMRQQLADVRGKIAQMRSMLVAMEKNRDSLPKEFRDNLLLIEFYKALYPSLVEKARVDQLFHEKSGPSQQITAQVKDITESIRREKDKVLSGYQVDYQALMGLEASLLEEIRQVEEAGALLAEKGIAYTRLLHELKQAEKNYLLFLDKAEEVRIESRMIESRVSNVFVVSWGNIPTDPVFPRRGRLMLLAVIIGLILGVAGAHISYYFDHTVKTPLEVARYAGVPVFCDIARIGLGKK